jgi:outer membrane lipoprotein SlyB
MANKEKNMPNRPLKPLALAALLAALGSTLPAHAQPNPKEQYIAETKHIAQRYADDKKLCSEENSSGARMQCTRDAKAEYDKSMALAKAHRDAKPAKPGECRDCAKVTSVVVSDKAGEGSALGVIAGGVAGALLGNQVGSGHGRQLATVAGAAGGAYAGNKIEQKAKSTKLWTVHVQYDDGKQAAFNFDHDPRMISGDRVQNANGTIERR